MCMHINFLQMLSAMFMVFLGIFVHVGVSAAHLLIQVTEKFCHEILDGTI